MRYYLMLLAAYGIGCSESQPRTRTQLLNNAASSGDANAGKGISNAKNENGPEPVANIPEVDQKMPAEGSAIGNEMAPSVNNATVQPPNTSGSGQIMTTVLAETSTATSAVTLSPVAGSQPAQGTANTPAPPVKPDCPSIPKIDSPINNGDGECGDACREKLRKAANYVNNLSSTKPKLNIPDGSKLQDKIVAQNFFRLVDAAGQKSAEAYKTACNPLAGKKYRP